MLRAPARCLFLSSSLIRVAGAHLAESAQGSWNGSNGSIVPAALSIWMTGVPIAGIVQSSVTWVPVWLPTNSTISASDTTRLAGQREYDPTTPTESGWSSAMVPLAFNEVATGIESIHRQGEYHGDLHTDNVIVMRYGLGFELKLLDMYHWGAPSAANLRHDVHDLVRIFYDAVGGSRFYARQPQEVKDICCGLKRTLITRKFRTAGTLRRFLETAEWE